MSLEKKKKVWTTILDTPACLGDWDCLIYGDKAKEDCYKKYCLGNVPMQIECRKFKEKRDGIS